MLFFSHSSDLVALDVTPFLYFIFFGGSHVGSRANAMGLHIYSINTDIYKRTKVTGEAWGNRMTRTAGGGFRSSGSEEL